MSFRLRERLRNREARAMAAVSKAVDVAMVTASVLGAVGDSARGVLGAAERLKVIQAGSLHAYLAYVIVLVLSLVLLLWWQG